MFKCCKKNDAVEKLNELIASSKLNDLFHKKEEKKKNGVVIALAIIGAIAAVAGIAYLVYKWMNPDYLEEYDDYDDEDYEDDDLDSVKDEAEQKVSEETAEEGITE